MAQGNSTLNPKDEFKYRGAMTLNTVGGVLSDVGDGLVITGYGVSLTGVGAPLGAGLSTVGGSVALVGNGLQFTYAYMHDDYYAMGKILGAQALSIGGAKGAAILGRGFEGIGKQIIKQNTEVKVILSTIH